MVDYMRLGQKPRRQCLWCDWWRQKGKCYSNIRSWSGGSQFPVKAISSKGHEFDVKGIKVKEDEVEGVISGLNVWIRYYSHVKALAPAHANQKEN